MKKIVWLLVASFLALSSAAFAHSGLSSSTPANRAMLMAAPQVLALEFSAEVRLLKLKLSTQQGRKIDFKFKPTGKGATNFSYPLPELAVGNYKVEWMAMGGDAHKMKGKFNFMVHGKAMNMNSTMPKVKDSHSAHQH